MRGVFVVTTDFILGGWYGVMLCEFRMLKCDVNKDNNTGMTLFMKNTTVNILHIL